MISFNNDMDYLGLVGNKKLEMKEGDYKKDGIIYCGKCNTPKQTKVAGVIVNCVCDCEMEKIKERDKQYIEEQKKERVKKMRDMCFPEKKMREWTFEKDDGLNSKMTRVAKRYVDNFDEMKLRGKGLLLFGSVGSGKTFIASCIVNALIDKNIPCVMTNFNRLVNTLFGMKEGKQDYLDKLNNVDLLVIDDFASERNTEYMNDIVFNIIDARYRVNLPTIITTNLTSDELKNASDIKRERIYSRLLEMCIPIEYNGVDRRKEKLKKEFDEMSELLGLKE